jgi:hypothetical protein
MTICLPELNERKMCNKTWHVYEFEFEELLGGKKKRRKMVY